MTPMNKRIIEFDINKVKQLSQKWDDTTKKMNDIRARQKEGVETTEYEDTELLIFDRVEEEFERVGL